MSDHACKLTREVVLYRYPTCLCKTFTIFFNKSRCINVIEGNLKTARGELNVQLVFMAYIFYVRIEPNKFL